MYFHFLDFDAETWVMTLTSGAPAMFDDHIWIEWSVRIDRQEDEGVEILGGTLRDDREGSVAIDLSTVTYANRKAGLFSILCDVEEFANIQGDKFRLEAAEADRDHVAEAQS